MEFIGSGSEIKHANRNVLQLFSLPETYSDNEFQIRVTREIITGQNVVPNQLPGIKMHPSRQLVARFTKFHNYRGRRSDICSKNEFLSSSDTIHSARLS